ncbi:diguanylate cyclase [Niveibacterium sp. SC-1]|uniref:diguanylate cyclase domain-containing protein n=1 Tax=Niveibacterium sp. SC-1 TaxID=3135646 RepID=UPI00311F8914
MFAEKERATVSLDAIGDAVLTTDVQGKVIHMNCMAETMTGWPREEAIGRSLTEVFQIIDGQNRESVPPPAQRAIVEDRTVALATDLVLIHRNGAESAIEDSAAPVHNRDGTVAGAVIVFHDISQSRAMAQRMAHLAQHDALTGLPNRMTFSEHLTRAIGLAQRHHKLAALLFLDLDRFKHINDSLGHGIGDALLQSVSQRLLGCMRATDTVCRQGGDEFVILLTEIKQAEDAARVAEALHCALQAPHFLSGHELHIGVSIGISVYPVDGLTPDALMQRADAAMYQAKAIGHDSYQFFRSDMNA